MNRFVRSTLIASGILARAHTGAARQVTAQIVNRIHELSLASASRQAAPKARTRSLLPTLQEIKANWVG
jgi:hypothetical protein